MGRACSTHGREEKCNIFLVKLKGRDHSEAVGVEGRIILEWILEK
jgi:hypothetical protein